MKIFSGSQNIYNLMEMDGIIYSFTYKQNFYPFITNFKNWFKYNCRINLYKNSFINLKVIKKNYPQVYRKFIYKIKNK